MQVPVRNQSGDTVDTIDLDDLVFNVPMNKSLVHQAMVIYQSNRRQGTHDTKTRSEVSGGGRKPWVQKHTGRARQGSTRSPQWRHGGVVFGPHPRSYRKALPKKMRRLALRCVLSDKARSERIVCLDSTDGIDGRTRSMAGLLERLDVSGSALIVTLGTDQDVVRAASNLKKVYTLPVNQLNAETLLSKDTVIMTVEAARWAEDTLASDPHGRRGRKFQAQADEDGEADDETPEEDGVSEVEAADEPLADDGAAAEEDGEAEAEAPEEDGVVEIEAVDEPVAGDAAAAEEDGE